MGWEDTENLGLRILHACLERAGHHPRLVPFSGDPRPVIAAICESRPRLVGFSIIFQNLTGAFQDLIRQLREAGVSAHFTAGGHYPSFAFEALLTGVPGLDSVVRFEGEDTLVELADAVGADSDLRQVRGLALRDEGAVITTASREGRHDLDSLPWPHRDDVDSAADPLPSASLLGSRGCPHSCTFCSISPFYHANGTPGRRMRDPADVADEMGWLHERGAQVLLFQDDDFLAGGRQGVQWAHTLASEVKRRGLASRVRWRIACRSDEVKVATLRPLLEAGLAHVYLGVESGDSGHLHDLGKRETAETHLAAATTLRSLGVSFDFGFMLLTPWSDFASLRRNLEFLGQIAGDGNAAVGFCRTLPYAGTEVARRLAAEGRLLPGHHADYVFQDPRLDALWSWLYGTFNHRNQHAEGTRNLLSTLLFEACIRLPSHPWDSAHERRLRALIAWSNQALLDVVGAAIDRAASREGPLPSNDPDLAWLAAHHLKEDAQIRMHLRSVCDRRRSDLAACAQRQHVARPRS